MHFTHNLPSVQKAAQYIALLLALVISSCQTKKDDSPAPAPPLGQTPQYTFLHLGNFHSSGPLNPSTEMRYELGVKSASHYSRGLVVEGDFETKRLNWFSLDTLEGNVDLTIQHRQLRDNLVSSSRIIKQLRHSYFLDHWFLFIGCGLDKYFEFDEIVYIPYVYEPEGENYRTFIFFNADPKNNYVHVRFNNTNVGSVRYGTTTNRYDYIPKPNDRLIVVNGSNAADTLYNVPIDSLLPTKSGLIVQGAFISYVRRDTIISPYIRGFARGE